jgi:hypothetical protein
LRHLRRISQQLGGAIVRATIKERLFDLAPGDAIFPPILSADVDFQNNDARPAVAELGGSTMFTPSASCALNRYIERVFNPDRKDDHWGYRKLAREQ